MEVVAWGWGRGTWTRTPGDAVACGQRTAVGRGDTRATPKVQWGGEAHAASFDFTELYGESQVHSEAQVILGRFQLPVAHTSEAGESLWTLRWV